MFYFQPCSNFDLWLQVGVCVKLLVSCLVVTKCHVGDSEMSCAHQTCTHQFSTLSIFAGNSFHCGGRSVVSLQLLLSLHFLVHFLL